MKRIDFLLISTDSAKIARCQEIAKDFGYVYEVASSVDDFAERSEELGSAVFVLMDAKGVSENDVAGMVQVIRQITIEGHIVTAIDSKLTPEAAAFIKKSGASVVLLENELALSAKLEFIASQKIRASYLPVKVSELVKNTNLECSLYHLMPLNRKFLPVITAGKVIDEARLKKLEEVGEVYVKREDVHLFKKYIDTFEDKSAAGLGRRCRAQFLNLSKTYTDLILLITDQSEYASYDKGKDLYNQVGTLANDLLMNLGALGEAWQVVNNSAFGEFGSIERGPSVAAYAGLLSLMSGVGDPVQVMVAAMMSDVGMLDLHPRILKKIRLKEEETLNEEDRAHYENHPLISVNRSLGRKLPLPDLMKNVILCTHERADQKGFPNKVRSEKIPMESQLIQFCELLDKNSVVEMGKERIDIQVTRKELFLKEYENKNRFTFVFLEQLKKVL